ncbi:nucleolar complex protein 3 homolog [Mizuhopecten yessoensis]|uniref:Nucleolar complex protein 3 homolog n=1 Tax=Mizuhopecten yessoensis TaxID=6573 RepID=A0A210Q2Y8_MIZYE|nr:nucleolar complex protein 3 homolog [Mizuhopecten yessoensis]OWF43118.1 Nucleolar complex protein 3-like [Mizuhopecten yessoensis]
MKKSKGQKRGKKASVTKLNNKLTTRLARQGKLKKKKPKKREHHDEENSASERMVQESRQQDSHQSELSEEDVDYFSTPGMNQSFVKSSLHADPSSRKRKYSDTNDTESAYEKLPRRILHKDNNQNIKSLLPIKTKRGMIIPQMVEDVSIQDEDEKESAEEETCNEPGGVVKPEKLPELNSAQLMSLRKQKLTDRRRRIAILASALIENPEANIRKLKELRSMLEEEDPDVYLTVRKLAMVSLMEVFKDIVPDYRLRIATQEEKSQRARKETKTLRDFEESFILNYHHYLEFLERTVRGQISKKAAYHNRKKERDTGQLGQGLHQDNIKVLKTMALRCLCQMLVTHPHFNYRNNIVTVIVPFMNKADVQMSCIACDTVRNVFREDRGGHISLEIVKAVSKMIKSRDFKVKREVLDTFLSLRIKEVDYEAQGEKLTGQQRKDMKKKMSKREKKRKKQMEELEKELQETKATEDKRRRMKLHTETIQAVFLTYFRILKGGVSSELLSAVLEGLAKFAHLINVDFFDDLFKVFDDLISSGELSYRESLHCVQTAFIILSGQGAALNIDPMTFYTHLYNTVFNVHAGCSSEDIPIILNCLDAMVTRRKRQISQQRVLAFIKRLITLALMQSHEGSLPLLLAVRNFILTYKSSEMLFDNETQGSGVFLPELSDPEHCNAHNTMLWELQLLKHHYHPVTRRISAHVSLQTPTSGEGQLTADLARKKPQELYEEHKAGEELFVPMPPNKSSSKNKTLHNKIGAHSMIQKDFNLSIVEMFLSVETGEKANCTTGHSLNAT